MTNVRDEADAIGAVPIVFDAPAGWCFGWFHAAQGESRSTGVVLCRPMGYEALCSYRTYTQLAQTLARAGFDVLRFDYHGTGDSAGADADGDRVQAWVASIAAAVDEVKRLTGVSRISLFGTRLGATLAAHAAVKIGGVDSLVLWAPCVTGRAFTREMRAAGAARGIRVAEGAGQGELEALGCLYTAQTVADLQALDCTRPAAAPARHALIIGRDDLPGEGPLSAAYRGLGMEVTYAEWPGYAGMMAEPHEAVLHPATLDSIAAWLRAAHTLEEAHARTPGVQPAWPGNCVLDGVRESAQRFGAGDSLFGILAEPAARRSETAVIMLNVGGNYRVGPNRIYVKAARALAGAGYCAFRFDLPGIGDSRTEAGFSSGNMYSRQSTPDVRAAIDFLAARGCKRFYLLGICSGSYVAFQTALADTRVTGQMLMNSRLLEWDPEKSGSWQSSMQRYYKSTDYYRRALLHSRVYQRLLRGEVDVQGIAARVWAVAAARVAQAIAGLLRRGTPADGVLPKVKRLSDRGIDTLMIMAVQDDGLDYVEFHLGRRGSRMKGHSNFRMVMVEDADHTFSTQASQRVVIDTLKEHLDRQHQPAVEWSGLPGRVATT